MPDPSLSQADLEAVAEALKRSFHEDEGSAAPVGVKEWYGMAQVAIDAYLAASRQPVSGGPEGDVEVVSSGVGRWRVWVHGDVFVPAVRG